MAYKKLAPRKKKPKKSKKSRNKSSTRANANPLSAEQGSSSSAETAAAPAVASPSVANTTAAPVANTAAAPAPYSLFSSLAGKLGLLESEGITRGRLPRENIFVSGNGAENLKVEIQGIPQKNNLALPSLVQVPITVASPTIIVAGEKVDFGEIISGTFRGAFAFAKVYNYPLVKYKPNALGALMFFRHALVHVNDYIYEDLKKKNAKQEEIEKALLTIAEIVDRLEQVFPKVALQLFDYMLSEGIDINTTIT